MARDVVNFTRPGIEFTKVKHSTGYESASSRSYGSVSFRRSTRSDSVGTLPAGGPYHKPTAYNAFFASIDAYPSLQEFYTGSFAGSWSQTTQAVSGVVTTDAWRYGCTAALVPTIPAEVIARARTSVIEQVRKTDLNFGQTLGEMRETIGLAGSILASVLEIRRRLRRLLKGQFRHILSMADRDALRVLPKTVASEYLRYKYGFLPLMQDAYGLVQSLDRRLRDTRGKCYSRVVDPSFGLPPPNLPGVEWFEGKVERGVKVEVNYKITNPDLYAYWRYGLTDPLALAWELTTLSFVFDWFTGFGNTLAGLRRPMGLSYSDGYETQFVDNRLTYNASRFLSSGIPGRVLIMEVNQKADYKTKAMRRVVGVGFSTPPVFLRWDLNLGQVLSLTALLASRA